MFSKNLKIAIEYIQYSYTVYYSNYILVNVNNYYLRSNYCFTIYIIQLITLKIDSYNVIE